MKDAYEGTLCVHDCQSVINRLHERGGRIEIDRVGHQPPSAPPAPALLLEVLALEPLELIVLDDAAEEDDEAAPPPPPPEPLEELDVAGWPPQSCSPKQSAHEQPSTHRTHSPLSEQLLLQNGLPVQSAHTQSSLGLQVPSSLQPWLCGAQSCTFQ